MNFLEIKAKIDEMIEAAKNGRSAITVADRFFDDDMLSLQNDSEYDQLCNLLKQDNYLQQIAMLSAEVNAFPDFFNQVRSRLLVRIQEEDDAAEAEAADD